MDPKTENQEHVVVAKAYKFLDSYCVNLNELVKEKRHKASKILLPTVKTTIKILAQETANVALLVGDSEIINQEIALSLAALLSRKNLPPTLAGSTLYKVRTGILQLHKEDEPQEYVGVVDYLIRSAMMTHSVLFIDNMCTFCELNFNEGLKVEENFWKGLSTGALNCVLAVSEAKEECVVSKLNQHSNPLRWYTKITAPKPNAEDSLPLLRNHLCGHLAADGAEGANFSDDAVTRAVDLSSRFFSYAPLPDNAMHLLEQTGQDLELETALLEEDAADEGAAAPSLTMTGRQVSETVARLLNMEVEELDKRHQMECPKLLTIEDSLRQRVFGQDEAIHAVACALQISAAGLKDPRKPVGVFLFAGSTGTGKTELAKALAEVLYGKAERLVRVDMSEYQESHTSSRLFGSPPGYVGYDQGGQLTNAVKKHPRSVVLLDEIDKAHPLVLNSFLQVFDDGRLTDGQGQTVSFAETLIIMTTNLGASALKEVGAKKLGFCSEGFSIFSEDGASQYRQRVEESVTNYLRTELVNRITQTIVFNPLNAETIRIILNKTIQTRMSLVKEKNLELHLSTSVYTLLEAQAFNPQYGAREAERAVDRLLIQPLAAFLLEHEGLHDATLHADVMESKIVFNEARSALEKGGIIK